MDIHYILAIIVWLIIVIAYCIFLYKFSKELENYHRLKKIYLEEKEEDKNV